MKHLILIILTSMLLVACVKTVLLDSTVERQGIRYEVNSQEPFTGVTESYFENGQLRGRSNYKAGVRDGLAEWYFENGELARSINNKAGEWDGLVEIYFENGQLKASINYKAGEPINSECWNEQGLTVDCPDWMLP
jgi:antitoxin component YwqK of YwqJK toxin-antitoxin module